MSRADAVRKTVVIHSQDQAVLHQVGKDMGLGSDSAAVRFIIRDWVQLKHRQLELPEVGEMKGREERAAQRLPAMP